MKVRCPECGKIVKLELAEKRMLPGVLQDAMDSLLPEERELVMKVFGEEMPMAEGICSIARSKRMP